MVQLAQLKLKDHAQLPMHSQQLVPLKEFQQFSTKLNKSTQFNNLLIALKPTVITDVKMVEWTSASTTLKIKVNVEII